MNDQTTIIIVCLVVSNLVTVLALGFKLSNSYPAEFKELLPEIKAISGVFVGYLAEQANKTATPVDNAGVNLISRMIEELASVPAEKAEG